MGERNSPYFAAGLADGATDAARNPRARRGYDPAKAGSWMYRRGFARAFLFIRALVRGGYLDDRPGTIDAMQCGLDKAWRVLDELMTRSAEVRQP
jgi:hypothetical protein